MEPIVISWIAVVVAGSTAAKLVGLFFKENGFGQVSGALIGIVGGILSWQPAVLMGFVDQLNPYFAAGLGFSGGLSTYISLALFMKKKKAQ